MQYCSAYLEITIIYVEERHGKISSRKLKCWVKRGIIPVNTYKTMW